MNKPKSYSKEFKFKVALEMVRGDLSIAEIISKYQVPRSVLGIWPPVTVTQFSWKLVPFLFL